ncbi:Heparinase II/III-like protein [compost metagenome]
MDRNNMRKIGLVLVALLISGSLYSQNIPLPVNLPQGHPRLLTTQAEKPALQKKIQEEAWAKEVLEGILKRIDPYVEKTQQQPDWLLSRLMMYWKSKATNVYINGGVYAKADGTAPVPTVRFGSTRGVSSVFKRPKLEDVIPYMDDTKGVYFVNSSKQGEPLEWVDQANASGANIESINNEILRLGRDGAFVYWLTGDEKYAKFAYDVFNTYMMGIYYRNEPKDLGNGHAQTLVAMTTFEVIQEAILHDLAAYYDFLHPYIQQKHGSQIPVFDTAFKKWIDLTIKNGVPHNNWNLHQAGIILPVAMVLEDNKKYEDGKGREYYINHILNVTTPRQWSIPKLMQYGYDFNNGVWNESPGYAQSVTKIFMEFIHQYDNTFNQNLLPYTPVMYKAVSVLPQYLFPNGLTSAFGDSYYGKISEEPIRDMVVMAQKHNNKADEEKYTAMYKLFVGDGINVEETKKIAPQVASFFTAKPLVLNPSTQKAKLSDYITPTFYAPNVSWLVQRNKNDSKANGLMISQYASYGNHAHSNGVAMELYGKGYILGAESGIGSSYFEKPYLEYYSQFPAHNTVMVDGVSKYPEMLSNHPFDLLSSYPASGKKSGYFPDITYSSVYFLEPESRSDQNRFLSIVSTGETTGYYVDIFRSKKQRKGDKFHDYFYHNLGQELSIQDTKSKNLALQSSDEMAFAGGHLFALDYMWDKRSVKTNNDYRATWKMAMPDSNHIYMNLWMKGYEGREVFSIKAPAVKSFRANHDVPYALDKSPYLTISARQHGEAWNHPFVSVFEPTTEKDGKSITSISSFEVKNASPDFVGLVVKSKTGRTDHIFSSVKDELVAYKNMAVNGTYGVITEEGKDFTLFLGNGKKITGKGFTIESKEKANVVLSYKNGTYSFTSDREVTITTAKNVKRQLAATDYKEIKL